MSDETRKGEDEILSLNQELDIDQISPEDLEDASGGALGGCNGCHGIYTPKPALDADQ